MLLHTCKLYPTVCQLKCLYIQIESRIRFRQVVSMYPQTVRLLWESPHCYHYALTHIITYIITYRFCGHTVYDYMYAAVQSQKGSI